jgi:hypothetical protein
MRIIRLVVNDVLNLRAIDIRPDKHVNKVSGKNAAGKTNLLDTIRFTLLGKKSLPPKPIREGQKKGNIEVDLGDYHVQVQFTKKGEYWKVTDTEGNPVSSPQSLLKELVGPISFDPLALLDTDQKKLREILLTLVGVDLNHFDNEIKKVRDERTVVGRTVKSTKALLDAAVWHEDAPGEEVSVATLAQEIDKAKDNNREMESLEASIQDAIEQIAEANDIIKMQTAFRQECEDKLQKMQPCDVESMQDQWANVEETNKQVRENAAFTLRSKMYKKEQAEYDQLTTVIESLESAKDEALAGANMPVPGLTVDDDGVVYEGIPLPQVNKAKRIEIGCAIHMAMNPKLKVMFVEGHHFDEETEAAIEAAVKDRDYQLFEEVVDDQSETGIHLEDGTVKE